MNLIRTFSKKKFPNIAIGIVIVVYIISNFSHHKWTKAYDFPRGVIVWDVISYYSYLPASIIYKDLSLEFLNEPGFENDNRFWPVTTEEGKKVILTSMGVSVLYSPFFFIAHVLAPVFGEPRDGFGGIYQFFLAFSALIYVGLAFIFLKKILRKYFSDITAAITILLIGLATNLHYYSTYEGAMSHSYSFSLIVLFMFLILKWLENPNLKYSIITGLVFGLIVLIRPTNIFILLFFIFAGVTNGKGFLERLKLFISKWPLVLVMMMAFVLVWVPQFLYWYSQTGKLFYNAYTEVGSAFFLDAPQIINVLFSYRKGLFIYVPLMIFAVFGITELYRQKSKFAFAVSIYFACILYVLSSWWSWWFGGSYGPRTFIDTYAIMSLPLAALIFRVENAGRKIVIPGIILTVLLLTHGILQHNQYTHRRLHHLGMTKEAYWTNHLLRFKEGPHYWQKLSLPDLYLARRGMYYFYPTGEDYSVYKELDPEVAKKLIKNEILKDASLLRQIKRYSKRQNESFETSMKIVVEEIYDGKKSGGQG